MYTGVDFAPARLWDNLLYMLLMCSSPPKGAIQVRVQQDLRLPALKGAKSQPRMLRAARLRPTWAHWLDSAR
jgi:hypothetical protein